MYLVLDDFNMIEDLHYKISTYKQTKSFLREKKKRILREY